MSRDQPAVLNVKNGSDVWSNGVEYTVLAALDLKTVLARSKEDGFSYKLRVSELKLGDDEIPGSNQFNLVELRETS